MSSEEEEKKMMMMTDWLRREDFWLGEIWTFVYKKNIGDFSFPQKILVQ